MVNANYFIQFVYIILSIQAFSEESINLEQNNTKKMFSGIIEFPVKTDLNLCLFYKGEKLFSEKHNPMPWFEYSFYDSVQTNTIYMVITNNVSICTHTANTLNTLKICSENNYICYKLQAKRNIVENENTILTWEISDHQLKDSLIPVNSLIFLFDPQFIAGLKTQSWKAENIFRIIPTILIKPDISKEEIDRALTIAELASLDIKALHTKNKSHANSTIISIPKN